MTRDYKNESTFCSALWSHLHVINDGRAYACCQTPLKSEYSFGNVKEQSFLEIMNSDSAKKMRKDMLDGKPLPEQCHRCIDKGDHGLNTMRAGMNSQWYDAVADLVQSTQPDGTISEARLLYWDFRFSNECNLACVTCAPLFSTSWSKDWKVLHPNDETELGLISLEKSSLFWEEIERNLSSMQQIHFAGGEPLIMPEHWNILQLLDEKGRHNVRLRYSTNGTTLGKEKYNVLDYWKKFKDVHLSLSIDGVGDAFEYIRYRGNWNKTFENIKRIRASRSADYWIHPTVSILNIFRLTELHNTLHSNDLIPLTDIRGREINIENYWSDRFHLNPLFVPSEYSITVMPKLLKDRCAEKIHIYGMKLQSDWGIPYSGWSSIIDFMYSSDNSHLMDNFKNKINRLDNIRNQNFYAVNPEFIDAQ
jgi:radical SAM protein with 4Fe4S-binding SPASM domain